MGGRATTGGRYDYCFPLALLGFVLLALPGWESVGARDGFGWSACAPQSGTGYVIDTANQVTAYYNTSLPPVLARSPLGDGPWALLITATLVGTVAWYARQARRAGRSTRAHVALAVGGGLAVPACHVVAGIADAIGDPASIVPSVGVPLLGFAALTGAWARLRPGPWRRTAAVAGAVCLVTGAATVPGAWVPGLLAPVLTAAGLLALARYWRSSLLVVLACTVPVLPVVFPDGTMGLPVPAVVVLAAAFAALVRRTGVSAPA